MYRRSFIVASVARSVLLAMVISETLPGEVRVPNCSHSYSRPDSLSYLSNHGNTAEPPFEPARESGDSFIEWQHGAITVPEKLDMADLAIANLVRHVSIPADRDDLTSSVARLVRGHEVQIEQLITLTSDATQSALFDEAKRGSTWEQAATEAQKHFERPADDLLRYLLYADEAELITPIQELSDFKREFEQPGPFDRRGRTLRDLDPRTRVFRYPCSYLIYSREWDALAEPAKSYVYHRLHEVLTGKDRSPEFSGLTSDARTAILEILLDTKPDLPSEWRQSSRQRRHARAELGRIQSPFFTY
jgi:hypothetical protein